MKYSNQLRPFIWILLLSLAAVIALGIFVFTKPGLDPNSLDAVAFYFPMSIAAFGVIYSVGAISQHQLQPSESSSGRPTRLRSVKEHPQHHKRKLHYQIGTTPFTWIKNVVIALAGLLRLG